MTKSPFIGLCKRGEGLLDLVHTYVCGPFRSATKDRKSYYATFTDDFIRYGYVYLIKHKSNTSEVFKRYQNEVENQLGKKIKVLQSDRGGEYLSIKFFDHLKTCGIVSQLTPPRIPQLNRVDERRNRTLLDMVRSMMIRTTLPIGFWGYALETVAHILNLVPAKKVSKTPFEMWKGKSQRGVFLEREMISKEDSGSKIDLEEIQETSGRVSKPPQFYYGFHIEEDKISDSTLSELDKLANYKETMACPEAAK
ncbi:retrotransposon protein, putative, ty1-copia subclass [Tanacetum coccineum]